MRSPMRSRAYPRSCLGTRWQDGVVGCDDRRPDGVIACVQDEKNRVPNPLARTDRPEVIQDQHLGVHDRPQDLHLGRGNLWIVGILNGSKEFAIVAEDAFGASLLGMANW